MKNTDKKNSPDLAAFKFLLDLEELNADTSAIVPPLIYILDNIMQSSEDFIHEIYETHSLEETRVLAEKEFKHLNKISKFIQRRLSQFKNEISSFEYKN